MATGLARLPQELSILSVSIFHILTSKIFASPANSFPDASFESSEYSCPQDNSQLKEYKDVFAFHAAIRDNLSRQETCLDHHIEHYLRWSDKSLKLRHADFFQGWSTDRQNQKLADWAKVALLAKCNHKFPRIVFACVADTMGPEENYSLYQQLYRQEQDIVMWEADITTLRLALFPFPNLRRITLTCKAWKPWRLESLYYSPFYRSLPAGFLKPLTEIPRLPSSVTPSEEAKLASLSRRYGCIVSTLSESPHASKITDFVIDVQGQCNVGIRYLLFKAEREFDQTLQMMEYLPVRRLELAINNTFKPRRRRSPGTLRSLLTKMKNLEYLGIAFKLERPSFGRISLQDIFPLIVGVKEFHLSGIRTDRSNMMQLLSKDLPDVETIFLGDFYRISLPFIHGLLHEIREDLVEAEEGKWRTTKPGLVIRERLSEETSTYNVVDEDVYNFLYNDGPCPWDSNSMLASGIG
ncbi:hypothetical protein BCR34DRAFT_611250 [Clohesyomyces aquaticus]|uniref:F-box domain-containing protein n=1 Tax=Clohesyomyces aquaticus TaxID=1231657 RepID=A0A1Y2A355_9PLEO|nr:hypothetical protein BCR34DRAFT_611250 [Clohesyomyces aquaticus]